MDRRKTLAAVGAISLTASAAVVALGSSMGLFGLANESPRVGKLSPIDATQPARTEVKTIYVDDAATGPASASDSSAGTTSNTPNPGRPANAENHDANDDRVSTTTTTNPTPEATKDQGDDHGGQHETDGADHSGSGSSHGGGHDDD